MICIFDMDGTIADSMQHWSMNMLRILDRGGVDIPPDVIHIATPMGNRQMAEYFRSLGVTLTCEQILAALDDMISYDYAHTIECKPWVIEFLWSLKNKGDRLCVLTASPHRLVDPFLKKYGIFDLFDHIWSSDDFEYGKSDGRIYEKICGILNTAPDDITLYDDNRAALCAAHGAGLHTVGVYDDSSADEKDAITSFADGYITCFSDFLPLS